MVRFVRSGLCPALVAGVILSCVHTQAEDADTKSLAEQNKLLRERVDRLESELLQLRGLIGDPAHEGSTEKKVTSKSVGIELYGYIKLDAAYDDSRTSVGNFARWVESEGNRPNDDQFNMTANQTRLGLNITAPDLPHLKATGKIEIDFYGTGSTPAENKPEPMLRHAYVNAKWPDWQLSLLAGQTSDIISPLTAPTINYSVAWWQGNIGYRRPQLRLTKDVALSDSVHVKIEAGATRTIGRLPSVTDGKDPDTGSDAGFPTVQGRVSLTLPVCEKRKATIGVSGHWGREEQHLDLANQERTIDTWSGNVDLTLPITSWLMLQAEGFIGANLDAYLGGIGQGFNPVLADEVESKGGWVAVSLGPWKNWQFNIGAGVDDPHNDDLTAAEAKTRNAVVFGNLWYTFSSHLSLGFEISHLRTEYRDQPSGSCLREQLSVMFKF